MPRLWWWGGSWIDVRGQVTNSIKNENNRISKRRKSPLKYWNYKQRRSSGVHEIFCSTLISCSIGCEDFSDCWPLTTSELHILFFHCHTTNALLWSTIFFDSISYLILLRVIKSSECCYNFNCENISSLCSTTLFSCCLFISDFWLVLLFHALRQLGIIQDHADGVLWYEMTRRGRCTIYFF